MKRFILLILMILVLIGVINNYKEDCKNNNVYTLEFGINPYSNSVKDQYIKKQVKTNLEIELEEDLSDSKTITTSRKLIKENINNYKNTIKNVLNQEKQNQDFTIDYGNHYFPEKKYKGVIYPKGNYESLLVTIGQGQGDNWWCVLFPPICSLDSDENNNKNIEYSLYVKEMFNKYIK